jgi:hypothetical protein
MGMDWVKVCATRAMRTMKTGRSWEVKELRPGRSLVKWEGEGRSRKEVVMEVTATAGSAQASEAR